MHSELLLPSTEPILESELDDGNRCCTCKSRSQNARAEHNACPDSDGARNAERSIGVAFQLFFQIPRKLRKEALCTASERLAGGASSVYRASRPIQICGGRGYTICLRFGFFSGHSMVEAIFMPPPMPPFGRNTELVRRLDERCWQRAR